MKLPKNLKNLNLTNEEYIALSKEDKIFLAENLCSNIWEYHSECYPDMPKPKLPCVINGILVGE